MRLLAVIRLFRYMLAGVIAEMQLSWGSHSVLYSFGGNSFSELSNMDGEFDVKACLFTDLFGMAINKYYFSGLSSS